MKQRVSELVCDDQVASLVTVIYFHRFSCALLHRRTPADCLTNTTVNPQAPCVSICARVCVCPYMCVHVLFLTSIQSKLSESLDSQSQETSCHHCHVCRCQQEKKPRRTGAARYKKEWLIKLDEIWWKQARAKRHQSFDFLITFHLNSFFCNRQCTFYLFFVLFFLPLLIFFCFSTDHLVIKVLMISRMGSSAGVQTDCLSIADLKEMAQSL